MNDDASIIYCGRGRGYENLPGNQIFRRVIKEHAFVYSESSARGQKSEMVCQILLQLKGHGMTFVKLNRKRWVTLTTADQKVKVGHALRDAVAELKKQHVKVDIKQKKKTKRSGSKAKMVMQSSQPPVVVSDDDGSTSFIGSSSVGPTTDDGQLSDLSEEYIQRPSLREDEVFELFLANLTTVDVPMQTHAPVQPRRESELVIDPLHFFPQYVSTDVEQLDDPFEPEDVYNGVVGV